MPLAEGWCALSAAGDASACERGRKKARTNRAKDGGLMLVASQSALWGRRFSDALAPRAPAGFLRGCMLSDVRMTRRRCVQLRPSGRLAWGFPGHGAVRVVLVSPWSSGICNSPRAAPVPSWCRAHDERSGAPFAEAWRANSIRCLPSPLLVALVLTSAYPGHSHGLAFRRASTLQPLSWLTDGCAGRR